MIKEEMFLEKDIIKAKRELDCLEDLATELKMHIDQCNLATAQLTLEDIAASLRELKQMKLEKRKSNQLNELARELCKKNIKAEVIKCYTACSI